MGKIYGLQSLELRPGVEDEDFERFLLSRAEQLPPLPGWRIALLKGEPATRSGNTLRSSRGTASKPVIGCHRAAGSMTPQKVANGSRSRDRSSRNGSSMSSISLGSTRPIPSPGSTASEE
ncbi:hypothetical protein [Microbacterium deminutum]|uniref:hypothetical protein n=1 Tax=Microbacterium deminutum TaxID=344164 RepID=UPI0031DEEF53